MSEKDRSKVENAEILFQQIDRLFENENQFIQNFLCFAHIAADGVISGTVTVWDNAGAEDFWTYYDSIFYFPEDKAYSEYISDFPDSETAEAFIWCAGYGLCPEYTEDWDYFSYTVGPYVQSIVEECVMFNDMYTSTQSALETISEGMIQMNNDFGEIYENEMDDLNDWYVDLKLYADLALNPSGNLSSYISSANSLDATLDRYEAAAGY